MNDKDAELTPEAAGKLDEHFETVVGDFNVENVSSSAASVSEPPAPLIFDAVDDSLEASSDEETELSPVFKKLAEPKLPVLQTENRAYLQMQSPTRMFFYWSVKEDSFETLRKALGQRAFDYALAARIVDLTNGKEDFFPIESKGSWWFNVEPNTEYRAEVGFYAVNRPFVRLVFTNTLETPRLKPSDNRDYRPYFAVTADQFAEVLDLAGYSNDAFEVYLKGDEPRQADAATRDAFVQITGDSEFDFAGIDLGELRYILFALASGVSLASLRDQISTSLFEILSAIVRDNAGTLTEENAVLALETFFGIGAFDEELEEENGPAVFGASRINFPRRFKSIKRSENPDSNPFLVGKRRPLSPSSIGKRQ